MNIEELRKERMHLSVRISNAKKRGKDTAEFEKQLADIRAQIANLKVSPVPKPQPKANIKKAVKVKPAPKPVIPATKTWTKQDLSKCKKYIETVLEENDWGKGYQFRSSEWMFINNLSLEVIPDSVVLNYTIQYKTKNHRVEKQVTKYFNPDTMNTLQKYIDDIELWVMLNSGDMDDKTIIFGARFNKVQFDAKGMAEQGWIVKK